MSAVELDEAGVAPATTGSRFSRGLGFATLAALAVLLWLALVASPPEVSQRDAVRLFYLHVPSAIMAFYVGFGLCALGSAMYLWRRTTFWDVVAEAGAEIGTLFCALALLTGALWGKPTWGVYWEWEPRLTSTAISFAIFVGYLAIRRMDLPAPQRAQRAAVVGIIGFLNVFIVRYSVQWWRGLHQGQTFSVDTQLDGLMLFTFFWGLLTLGLVFWWLFLHRFRVGWLTAQLDEVALDEDIAARRRDDEWRDTNPDRRLGTEGI